MSQVNLILIGMPGTGKSTLGEGAAKALGLNFVDTDQIIEDIAGFPLQEVLNQGKDKFSELEDKALKVPPQSDQLIATGGSAIYCKKTLSSLKETAVIVHLVASIETLEERIDNFASRGIVIPNGMNFNDLYAERMPLYKNMADAELITDYDNPTLPDLIEKLVALYNDKRISK